MKKALSIVYATILLIALLVIPAQAHLDFGHIRVVFFGHGKDLGADMFLGDALGVVFGDASQAHEVAPNHEAVAGEVKLIDILQPGVFLVTHQRISVHKILLQGKNFRFGDGNETSVPSKSRSQISITGLRQNSGMFSRP